MASICGVSSPLLVGSGKFGNPWVRRQRANARNAAICAGLCAAVGRLPSGSRCWQVVAADWNRGDRVSVEFGLMAGLISCGEVVGSGRLVTPWERMQSAKLTVSCSFWACVRWPPDLDVLGRLGEFEPQAAIIVAAAIATIRRLEVGLRMTEV